MARPAKSWLYTHARARAQTHTRTHTHGEDAHIWTHAPRHPRPQLLLQGGREVLFCCLDTFQRGQTRFPHPPTAATASRPHLTRYANSWLRETLCLCPRWYPQATNLT